MEGEMDRNKGVQIVEVLMSTASGVNKKDAGNVIIPFLVH